MTPGRRGRAWMVRVGLLLLVTALALPACGRKPDTLLPPQGEANDRFPQPFPPN